MKSSKFVHYMNKERILKYTSFGLIILITVLLMAATVVEKFCGSTFVRQYIYSSPVMIVLWGLMALSALGYLLQRGIYRQKITFLLHISFALILAGALTTHLCGRQGRLHLRVGDDAVNSFVLSDGNRVAFPFEVALDDFELRYYQGTLAPMDYISNVTIQDDDKRLSATISMNNIFKYRGYRFYQSGYDADNNGTTLSVSFDPLGTTITYTGYLCLLVSMLLFFFQQGSIFRSLLKHPILKRGAFMLLIMVGVGAKAANIPDNFADSFGKLYVYHNDRIVPLQTLARNYTAKLCGDVSYGDLSAEQLLCEMFFNFKDWQDAPIIKVKGKDIRTILGIEGAYASINDFMDGDSYKLSAALRGADAQARRNAEAATEKYNLVMLCSSGMLLNIVPVVSANTATVEWHSVADRSNVIIDSTVEQIANALYAEDYDKAISLVEELKSEQQKVAQTVLPNNMKFNAELLYNKVHCGKPIAIICIVIGLVTYMLTIRRNTARALFVPMCLLFAYISLNIVIRAFISGHIPLSNGFETMTFMAWCCSLFAIIFSKRFRYAMPFGFLLGGFSLLVAMMGESTPQITQLMPVLHSPLLSIHVMLIMVAYTLLAITMLNGITAIVLQITRTDTAEQIEYLSIISRILLYPSLFLLTVGIFIGAVWANVSWGRYWGWDPKEVWALITMLIYALAIHVQSLKWFRKPIHFHLFCVVAFLSVLMTYFGVNFVLGGLHSYA